VEKHVLALAKTSVVASVVVPGLELASAEEPVLVPAKESIVVVAPQQAL
jgi:hypothetical protein